MPRKRYTPEGLQRAQEYAQERHRQLERERVEREEAALRASATPYRQREREAISERALARYIADIEAYLAAHTHDSESEA